MIIIDRGTRTLEKKLAIVTIAALIAGAVLLFRPEPAFASTAQTDFFREGVSARSFGMGNAFVGVADDVGTGYWNPAGLALLGNYSFSTTRSTQDEFDDMTTQGFSFARPMGKGVLGFNAVYTTFGDFPACASFDTNPPYRCLSYMVIGEDDTAVSFSYGWRHGKNLLLGASIKHARQEIKPSYNSSGWGFDIGALMEFDNGMKAGITLQNAGDMTIGEDTIPFNVILGASGKIKSIKHLKLGFSIETGYLDESLFSIGAEYELSDNLRARIGSGDGDFAAGLGVNFENLQLDYAFNKNDLQGDQSKLTLGYYVDPSKKHPKKPKEQAVPEEVRETPKPEEKPVDHPERRPRKQAEEQKAEPKKTEAEPAKKTGEPANAQEIQRKRGISESLKPEEEKKTAREERKQAAEMKQESDAGEPTGEKVSLPAFENLLGPAAEPTPEVEEKPRPEPERYNPGEGLFKIDE